MAGSTSNLGGCAIAGILIFAAIGSCLPDKDRVTAQGTQKYVAARSLNCRASDSVGAAVLTSLRRDESVTVLEERGDWARIEGSANCWVAARYLANSPSGTAASGAALLAVPSSAAGAGYPSTGERSGAGSSSSASLGSASTSLNDGNGYSASRSRAYASGQASISSGKKASVRKKASSWKKKKRGSKRGKKRSGGSSSSGYCPCSGSSICIGPRGGRYCITSGGNKRYGV